MEAKYLTRNEAAKYISSKGIPLSAKTLAKYATVGGSPEFRKFGTQRVVYELNALDQWIEQKLSSPIKHTSEIMRSKNYENI